MTCLCGLNLAPTSVLHNCTSELGTAPECSRDECMSCLLIAFKQRLTDAFCHAVSLAELTLQFSFAPSVVCLLGPICAAVIGLSLTLGDLPQRHRGSFVKCSCSVAGYLTSRSAKGVVVIGSHPSITDTRVSSCTCSQCRECSEGAETTNCQTLSTQTSFSFDICFCEWDYGTRLEIATSAYL